MPNKEDKELDCLQELSDEQREKKLTERRKFRLRFRYPQTVKKLSSLCSDVLAKNVLLIVEFMSASISELN